MELCDKLISANQARRQNEMGVIKTCMLEEVKKLIDSIPSNRCAAALI